MERTDRDTVGGLGDPSLVGPLMPDIVLLVPRRAHPDRDKLWEYAKARWEQYHPDIRIVEGFHEEGAFNRSAAVNIAARIAGDWDYAVVIDGDVFLKQSQVNAA